MILNGQQHRSTFIYSPIWQNFYASLAFLFSSYAFSMRFHFISTKRKKVYCSLESSSCSSWTIIMHTTRSKFSVLPSRHDSHMKHETNMQQLLMLSALHHSPLLICHFASNNAVQSTDKKCRVSHLFNSQGGWLEQDRKGGGLRP